MQSRTKVVEIADRRFHLRRLPPEVGSFIFMRMLGMILRQQKEQPSAPVTEEGTPTERPSGETQVKAMTFSLLSSGMGFEDFKFIQTACLRVVSLIEQRAGEDFPIPLLNDSGIWTPPHGESISTDVGLLMRLTSEVLAFCFADFFDGASPGLLT